MSEMCFDDFDYDRHGDDCSCQHCCSENEEAAVKESSSDHVFYEDEFKLSGTVTGRFSGTLPNIPKDIDRNL